MNEGQTMAFQIEPSILSPLDLSWKVAKQQQHVNEYLLYK